MNARVLLFAVVVLVVGCGDDGPSCEVSGEEEDADMVVLLNEETAKASLFPPASLQRLIDQNPDAVAGMSAGPEEDGLVMRLFFEKDLPEDERAAFQRAVERDDAVRSVARGECFTER